MPPERQKAGNSKFSTSKLWRHQKDCSNWPEILHGLLIHLSDVGNPVKKSIRSLLIFCLRPTTVCLCGLGFTRFIGSEGFKVTFIISSQVWTHYEAWLSRSLQIFHLTSSQIFSTPFKYFRSEDEKKVPVMCNKCVMEQGRIFQC